MIDVRSWSRTATVRDLALAAALALGAAVPGNATVGVELGDLPTRAPDALLVPLVLAQTLPLAVRRAHPAPALALVGAGFAAHQLLGYAPTVAGLGLYVALYSAGAHLARQRTAAVVALLGYLTLAGALLALGSPAGVVGCVTFAPVLVLFWAAGSWVRTRRTAQEALRDREAAAAVADERARIARELHDVVSHHVTAMVVQAEALQFVAERPERVVAGLEVIGETGRSAMTDLRDLLGALHGDTDRDSDGTREPAVGNLEDLAATARATGLVVDLDEDGPPAASSVELAVHRVVQESLTNAVKHAPGSAATVRVRRDPHEVTVEVTTRGAGRSRRRWPTSGRGLVGLQERVAFTGGRLVAGPEPDGGFAVRAWIPGGGRRG